MREGHLTLARHEKQPTSTLHESAVIDRAADQATVPAPSLLASGERTVFYLAYGSNLAAATFLVRRGIKPLRAINVAVPSLRLTFDLPGLPYSEPCFANTARRHPPSDSQPPHVVAEKAPLLCATPNTNGSLKDPYHKRRWIKPLVGVVYELTPSDYAHVIATEGGGASYHDIEVPCFELRADSALPVPMDPASDGLPSFIVHTLFAPARKAGSKRPARPDPDYAQPSQRYLDLLTSGAAEHNLPLEYQKYLLQIRSYTITSTAQRLGQFLLIATWGPVVMAIFALQPLFADKHGRYPKWLADLLSAVFAAVWRTYDGFFVHLFGDGERTVYKNGDKINHRSRTCSDIEKAESNELSV